MNANKWVGLGIYALLAATAVYTAGSTTSQAIIWLFIALGVIHFIEFVLKRDTLRAAGGSMGNHFLQTMLFGFVHWRPLEKTGD
jgi:hypothetical protein